MTSLASTPTTDLHLIKSARPARTSLALVGPAGLNRITTIEHYLDTNHNSIGWCSRTHNLLIGCSKTSEGCASCYAIDEGVHQILMHPDESAYKLVIIQGDRPNWTGLVQAAGAHRYTAPFSTRQHWFSFANSMSDLFHERLSDEQILFLLRLFGYARWHVWMVLTKRAARMADIMSRLILRDGVLCLAPTAVPFEQRALIANLWIGVSIETQRRADERIPHLIEARAAVRFLSAEPLLERLDLRPYMPWIDWTICGGESGKRFRPMEVAWAVDVRDQCVDAGVAYFFKQHAGVNPQFLSKTLDGQLWRQFPLRPVLDVPPDAERWALRDWAQAEYPRIFP